MPELPEVEAVRRRLQKEVTGAAICSARIIRARTTHPQSPSRVERLVRRQTIEEVRRRGKNLLLDRSGGLAIHVHLRMTGDLRTTSAGLLPPSVRAAFCLSNGRTLVFDDPRALGTLHVHCAEELAHLLGHIGPEPLSAAFTSLRFRDAARRSTQPAKLFLMDQRHVAGLGNIYAAEALFHAGIHPGRLMNALRPSQVEALHAAIREVLRKAVRSAVRAYTRPDRVEEAECFPFAVYGRESEPCPRCGRAIRRITQGGRSTYYCPGCQKG
jgi:formamidopyrimidine-DNA glycosylase